MPGPICGRRNDGKLCLSGGSGLSGGQRGPTDVLGRGRYRGEAVKCSSCFLLTAYLGIERVTRSRPIIQLFALADLSWKVEHTKKFLGSLTFCQAPFFRPSIVKILTLKISQFPRMSIVKKFTIQIVKILTYRSEIVKKLTLIYSQRLLKF